MGQVLLLLFSVSLLAAMFQSCSIYIEVDNLFIQGWKARTLVGRICYVSLHIALILFAGTRTRYNDTALYVLNFHRKISSGISSLASLSTKIGDNFGFAVFQTLIKTVFGDNSVWFLTISASIIYISFFSFFRKFSRDFSLSMYIFITSTLFFFTMAAMKQALAMSIAIWILPCAYQRRWIKCLLLMILAITFHPYVAIFALIPFVIDNVWTRKTVIITAIIIIIGSQLTYFLNIIFSVTEAMGDSYDIEWWGSGTSVTLARLAVFTVTPVMSIIFRRRINKYGDIILKACVNLSFIGSLFMYLASIGGANMFGRMAEYFQTFTIVALPGIIRLCFTGNNRRIVRSVCIACYLAFCIMHFQKYGLSLSVDYFQHASIFTLFQ